MNEASALTVWLQLIGLLAAEVALLFCAALLISRLTESAHWRRTIWQVCITSLLTMTLFELSGMARGVSGWLRGKTHFGRGVSSQNIEDQNSPRLTHEFRREVADRVELDGQPKKVESRLTPHVVQPASSAGIAPPKIGKHLTPNAPSLPSRSDYSVSGSMAILWLGLIWLAGSGVVFARRCLAHVLFALFRRRRRTITDGDLVNRAEALSKSLGIKRRIRLIESARLSGPIVFGVLRPTIGLPSRFTRDFSPARQDAMLAHELAHLAASDPSWYLLADLATAILWWHPLSWLARRQLHSASESAADEACLLVADGPNALAESLVELGGRLTRQRSFVWMGVEGNGFRSGLGRRVERLLVLRRGSWRPPARLRSALVKTFGPAVLVTVVILCSAWATPGAFTKGETMKTMKQTWKSTTAAFLLLAPVHPNTRATTVDSFASVGSHYKPVDPQTATNAANEVQIKADRITLNRDTGEIHAKDNVEVIGLVPPSSNDSFNYRAASKAANKPSPQNDDQERYQRMLRERYGLVPKGSAVPASGEKKEKGRVEKKLDEIVLDEVMFDGVPLPEVLKYLDDESRKRDPEKQGLNFLINPNVAPAPATTMVDPTTGQPIALPPPEPMDMNSVIVRFNLPLRSVRLEDVLDAIVKVADHPLEYSVEDYGVVFSQRPNPPSGGAVASNEPALQVRTFKVDSEKFAPGLQRAFGLAVHTSTNETKSLNGEGGTNTLQQQLAALKEEESRLLVQFTPDSPMVAVYRRQIAELEGLIKKGTPDDTTAAQQIHAALRRLFSQLGINMDVPGKAIFYNDLTGILMVRATAEDLEIVEAAIETLGGTANPQSVSQNAAEDAASSPLYDDMLRRRYGLLPAKR